MKKSFYIIAAALLMMGCQNKQEESTVHEEQDTTTVETVNDNGYKSPIYDRLCAELDSAEIYNDDIIYGYWFKPHEACDVNIFLHKNNTYELKYYDVTVDNEIKNYSKKGTFTFDGKVIKLSSDDGWDKCFNGVLYYRNNGAHYYIADKNDKVFYLVKGSD